VQKLERKEYSQPPSPPFDLTSLQVEAHRALGFDPKLTLELAQTLYENALISYPRTSSQKLPAKLNLKKIIESLSRQPEYSLHAKKLLAAGKTVPLEGKKEDPAHPAIHPTGQGGRAGEREMRLYDLIARRFLSCFAEAAVRESQKVTVASGNEKYCASGNRTVTQGWFEIYAPYVKLEEVALPAFSEGEAAPLSGFKIDEKKTQPPKRYTAASIISELEKRGLGTKATRASIVDTLFKRGYVDGKSIAATPFGLAVYELLSKAAPEILDDKLTHEIEKEMEEIRDGENEKKAIDKGKAVLTQILSEFDGHEREIGLGLLAGLRSKDVGENSIGQCQKCKTGQLRIIRMKNGRQFVGCTSYPECTATYSLPQGVMITPAKKSCLHCGTPMIRGASKGGGFEICPDPKCKGDAPPAMEQPKPSARAPEGAGPAGGMPLSSAQHQPHTQAARAQKSQAGGQKASPAALSSTQPVDRAASQEKQKRKVVKKKSVKKSA
jgi:DNA topoisomerase-1